jgi:hypothetical protein
VDFNEGRPVWHASIAAIDRNLGRCKVVSKWSAATRRCMAETAKELLRGVGQIPSTLEQGIYCLHYRRSITDAEHALLTPEWCAIPADSFAGRGFLLERDT